MKRVRTAAAVAAGLVIVAIVAGSPVLAGVDEQSASVGSGVPGAPTIIRVGPGGGSGEVELIWGAVPNATGYRVLRSNTADGPFEVAAEIDITTGTATAADDVVFVSSEEHTYIPPGDPLEAPDQSSQFTYIEFSFVARCFTVIAFNAKGDGPASAVSCGAPPGGGRPEPEPEPEPATPVPAEPTFTG
jgi:hypothetical protein